MTENKKQFYFTAFIIAAAFVSFLWIGAFLKAAEFYTVTHEIVQKDFDNALAARGYINIIFGICGKPKDPVGSQTVACLSLLTEQERQDFLTSSLTTSQIREKYLREGKTK